MEDSSYSYVSESSDDSSTSYDATDEDEGYIAQSSSDDGSISYDNTDQEEEYEPNTQEYNDILSTVEDVFCPTSSLMNKMKVSSMRDLLPTSKISLDIDSLILSSSSIYSILKSVDASAIITLPSSVNRIKASRGSRLSVTFGKQFPFMNHGKKVK